MHSELCTFLVIMIGIYCSVLASFATYIICCQFVLWMYAGLSIEKYSCLQVMFMFLKCITDA